MMAILPPVPDQTVLTKSQPIKEISTFSSVVEGEAGSLKIQSNEKIDLNKTQPLESLKNQNV